MLYPYRFNEFHWKLFEIDFFRKNLQIEIWDLSFALFKDFSKSMEMKEFSNNRILAFHSIIRFIRHLKKFLIQHEGCKINFINEIPRLGLRSLLLTCVLLYFKKRKKLSFLEFLNPGIPNFNENTSITKNSLFKKILMITKQLITNNSSSYWFKLKSILSNILGRCIPNLATHILVAGEFWEEQLKSKNLKQITMILGHSFDFSNYLLSINVNKIPIKNQATKAVFLDSAGPKFNSDTKLTHRKEYWTSENWYPSINRFFHTLEVTLSTNVVIAGHYKSNFEKDMGIFEHRDIVYNDTLKLVSESEFVVTRYSTAISYAVILYKPIILVYSNELLGDRYVMHRINYLSNLLDLKCLNINTLDTTQDFSLKINKSKYDEFIKNYLTSNINAEHNSKLILEQMYGKNFKIYE